MLIERLDSCAVSATLGFAGDADGSGLTDVDGTGSVSGVRLLGSQPVLPAQAQRPRQGVVIPQGVEVASLPMLVQLGWLCQLCRLGWLAWVVMCLQPNFRTLPLQLPLMPSLPLARCKSIASKLCHMDCSLQGLQLTGVAEDAH